MKLGIKKLVEVDAKEIRLHIKVCDMFECSIHDQDGKQIGEDYEGYVPRFFPEDHYGDYLILNIDLETGKILNWNPPTEDDINNLISKEEDD